MDLTGIDLLHSPSTDLFPVDGAPLSKSQSFLFEHLLKQPAFQFDINLDDVSLTTAQDRELGRLGILAKRLTSLHSENEDNLLEHGIQTFGFGYPFLIKRSRRDATKVVKAPVLIWNLEIERSQRQRNKWIIRRNVDSPIYLNEVLISHLGSDENIVIHDIPDGFLDDNLIDASELSQLINSVLGQLDPACGAIDLRLEPCLEKEQVEQLTTHTPWIMWSGVFGLYRTQKQSIIQDTEKLLKNFDEFDFSELKTERFLKTSNAAVDVDPSQIAILTSLDTSEFKVVQGPPGTGKSQSLTAIISSVLENNGKILVVCEKRTALQVIFDNLTVVGLDNLVAFIEDVTRDRKRVVDNARSTAVAARFEYTGFNEIEYDRKVETFSRATKDFNARNSNLNEIVFEGKRFRDLVAEYLLLKRTVSVNNNIFDGIAFKLNEEEYEELKSLIQEGVQLYKNVEKDAFVFDIISSNEFEKPFSNSVKSSIFERLAEESDFVGNFDSNCLEVKRDNLEIANLNSNNVGTFLADEFRVYSEASRSNLRFWEALKGSLLVVIDFINTKSLLAVNDFYGRVGLFGTLSADIARILRYFKSVNNSIDLIDDSLRRLPSPVIGAEMRYSWSTRWRKFFGTKYRLMSEFWATLGEERERIRNLDDSEVSNSVRHLKQIVELEEKLRVDQSHLQEQLRKCSELRDIFSEYYRWRRFLDTLQVTVKAVFAKLVSTVEPDEWAAAFKYIYTEQLIDKFEGEIKHFNEDDFKLNQISEIELDLRKLQKHKILKSWDRKQFESIAEYNRRGNFKWLFNYRRNTQFGRKNSLRNIVHQEFELFTDLFPVLLVTPAVASSILPLKQGSFDVVLFDEASQLRLEDTYPSLIRGRIKVISGDRHQMPPSSYFSSDISLEVTEDEGVEEADEAGRTHFERTNPLFLAESESLLDFGNNLNPRILN
ncbi:MAG TPA: DUF4011 domain-containing protein, partial [Pyrinomonadaceae bacterium]|nr:DUF4011 domain-containing protein [Pyrinomonadaceae bacterium]